MKSTCLSRRPFWCATFLCASHTLSPSSVDYVGKVHRLDGGRSLQLRGTHVLQWLKVKSVLPERVRVDVSFWARNAEGHQTELSGFAPLMHSEVCSTRSIWYALAIRIGQRVWESLPFCSRVGNIFSHVVEKNLATVASEWMVVRRRGQDFL